MCSGRFTTDKEVDYALEAITNNVARLRELSPLYDMWKEGIDIKSIQWTQENH
jgi:cysteine desulfurase